MIPKLFKTFSLIGPPKSVGNGVAFFGEPGRQIKVFWDIKNDGGRQKLRVYTEGIPLDHPTLRKAAAGLKRIRSAYPRIVKSTVTTTRQIDVVKLIVAGKYSSSVGQEKALELAEAEIAARGTPEEIRRLKQPIRMLRVEARIPVGRVSFGGMRLAEHGRRVTDAQVQEFVTILIEGVKNAERSSAKAREMRLTRSAKPRARQQRR